MMIENLAIVFVLKYHSYSTAANALALMFSSPGHFSERPGEDICEKCPVVNRRSELRRPANSGIPDPLNLRWPTGRSWPVGAMVRLGDPAVRR